MAKAKTKTNANANAQAKPNAPLTQSAPQAAAGQVPAAPASTAHLAPVPVPVAPTQTAQALARANVASKAPSGVGVTHHTNGQPIKGLLPKPQLAKPSAAILHYVASMGTHPGKGLGIKRWHLCKPGTIMLACKLGLPLQPCVADLPFWHKMGLIKLAAPSPAMVAAATAAWQAGTLAQWAATYNPLAGQAQAAPVQVQAQAKA